MTSEYWFSVIYSFTTIDINDADTGSWGPGDVLAHATADTLQLIAGSLGSRRAASGRDLQ